MLPLLLVVVLALGLRPRLAAPWAGLRASGCLAPTWTGLRASGHVLLPLGWPKGLRLCLAPPWALGSVLLPLTLAQGPQAMSCSPLGLGSCLAPPWTGVREARGAREGVRGARERVRGARQGARAGLRASGHVLLPLGLRPCLAPPWASPRASGCVLLPLGPWASGCVLLPLRLAQGPQAMSCSPWALGPRLCLAPPCSLSCSPRSL